MLTVTDTARDSLLETLKSEANKDTHLVIYLQGHG